MQLGSELKPPEVAPSVAARAHAELQEHPTTPREPAQPDGQSPATLQSTPGCPSAGRASAEPPTTPREPAQPVVNPPVNGVSPDRPQPAARASAELQEVIDELREAIAVLRACSLQPGPVGETGPQGEPGDDADCAALRIEVNALASDVTTLEKRIEQVDRAAKQAPAYYEIVPRTPE